MTSVAAEGRGETRVLLRIVTVTAAEKPIRGPRRHAIRTVRPLSILDRLSILSHSPSPSFRFAYRFLACRRRRRAAPRRTTSRYIYLAARKALRSIPFRPWIPAGDLSVSKENNHRGRRLAAEARGGESYSRTTERRSASP